MSWVTFPMHGAVTYTTPPAFSPPTDIAYVILTVTAKIWSDTVGQTTVTYQTTDLMSAPVQTFNQTIDVTNFVLTVMLDVPGQLIDFTWTNDNPGDNWDYVNNNMSVEVRLYGENTGPWIARTFWAQAINYFANPTLFTDFDNPPVHSSAWGFFPGPPDALGYQADKTGVNNYWRYLNRRRQMHKIYVL